MKPAWHGLSLRCLAIAFCLAVCVGCSAPPAAPAEPSAAVEGTPALIFLTPETEPSLSQEEPQAMATDSGTAEIMDPLLDVRTPVLVFFTPTGDQINQQEIPKDPGTPAMPPASGAGTPAPQFTRVALPLTPATTMMPRLTWFAATPRATASSQTGATDGETPFAQWPKGWWLAAVAVVAIIPIAWLIARRRP